MLPRIQVHTVYVVQCTVVPARCTAAAAYCGSGDRMAVLLRLPPLATPAHPPPASLAHTTLQSTSSSASSCTTTRTSGGCCWPCVHLDVDPQHLCSAVLVSAQFVPRLALQLEEHPRPPSVPPASSPNDELGRASLPLRDLRPGEQQTVELLLRAHGAPGVGEAVRLANLLPWPAKQRTPPGAQHARPTPKRRPVDSLHHLPCRCRSRGGSRGAGGAAGADELGPPCSHGAGQTLHQEGGGHVQAAPAGAPPPPCRCCPAAAPRWRCGAGRPQREARRCSGRALDRAERQRNTRLLT